MGSRKMIEYIKFESLTCWDTILSPKLLFNFFNSTTSLPLGLLSFSSSRFGIPFCFGFWLGAIGGRARGLLGSSWKVTARLTAVTLTPFLAIGFGGSTLIRVSEELLLEWCLPSDLNEEVEGRSWVEWIPNIFLKKLSRRLGKLLDLDSISLLFIVLFRILSH